MHKVGVQDLLQDAFESTTQKGTVPKQLRLCHLKCRVNTQIMTILVEKNMNKVYQSIINHWNPLDTLTRVFYVWTNPFWEKYEICF